MNNKSDNNVNGMPAIPIPTLTHGTVDQILAINTHLIRVLVEYQNNGWQEEPEFKIYHQRLQMNLTYLATAADYMTKPDPIRLEVLKKPVDLTPVKYPKRVVHLRPNPNQMTHPEEAEDSNNKLSSTTATPSILSNVNPIATRISSSNTPTDKTPRKSDKPFSSSQLLQQQQHSQSSPTPSHPIINTTTTAALSHATNQPIHAQNMSFPVGLDSIGTNAPNPSITSASSSSMKHNNLSRSSSNLNNSANSGTVPSGGGNNNNNLFAGISVAYDTNPPDINDFNAVSYVPVPPFEFPKGMIPERDLPPSLLQQQQQVLYASPNESTEAILKRVQLTEGFQSLASSQGGGNHQ